VSELDEGATALEGTETQGDTGQEPSTGGPVEGTSTAQVPTGPDGKPIDWSYVEKLRRENAEFRTRATDRDELAAELQAYRDAEMTAQERLERDLEEARQQAEDNELAAAEAYLRAEVARYAQDAHDQEDVINLLDISALEWDGPRPLGVKEALEQLFTAKPWLRKATTVQAPDIGATNPGGTRPGATLTLADVKKMSSDEINARWSEVSQVLTKG